MHRENTRPSARTLPLDIFISILLLLDPKALVQLMCVCKSWKNLISSDEFAARYLKVSASKNEGLILYSSKPHGQNINFFLLNGNTYRKESNLKIPFGIQWENIRIVGSSNGILCISEVQFFGFSIYLCNPSIRKYRVINSSTIPIWLVKDIVMGFAFHSQANDYKVVRVAYGTFKQSADRATSRGRLIKRSDYDVRAEIYSLNTNSWRAINNVELSFPWYISQTCTEVLVNESLHWLARDGGIQGGDMVILAFDLGEEKFDKVELPPFEEPDEYPNLIREFLGVLRGFLVVFYYCPCRFDPSAEFFELWVMTQYKNEKSWSRHDVIGKGIVIDRPLKITDCGQIIVRDDKNSVIINQIGSEYIVDIGIWDYQPTFVSFTKSLALINEINEPIYGANHFLPPP